MKSASRLSALGLCFASVWLGGCGSKGVANTALQKAASAMERLEPPQTVPQPAAQPNQQTPSAPATTQTAAPAKNQALEMNQALVAYKAGNLEDAVTRLHKLRATPVMSAEKRMALNDAMAAVMSEIYALAEKGDARAIQAVKVYEEMQTQRR